MPSETRMFMLKTPSGAGIVFDDNQGQECLQLTDWMGAGLRIDSPSQGTDPEDNSEKGQSPFRADPVRGTKTTWGGDPHPASKTKKQSTLISLHDVNGSGMVIQAKPGRGTVQWKCVGGQGESGPSFTMDSVANAIILQAGNTQLVINGKKNQVEATKQIIREIIFAKDPNNYQSQISKDLKTLAQQIGYREGV